MAVKQYLFLYNMSMTMGWGYILARLVKSHAVGDGALGAYASFALALKVFQTGSVLEVFHSILGFVRAPWATTLLQVFSRVFVVWVALHCTPPVQTHVAVSSMVGAWALTEVPRYLYFSVSAQGAPPRWLLWLRYSTFLVLYPIGAGSEMAVLYAARRIMAPMRLLSLTVGAVRVSLNVYRVTLFSLLSYVPGLPTMYHHMLHQRAKYLSPSAVKKPKVA